ncbi:hypothetical protein LXA43DRAFT_1004173 [Ganoderma leucocontextum]|nr:hypothetical protein LXA43DRAFT_1004173 [Ganoderma leucocontextum]
MSSPAILESTPELTNPSSCIPPLPSPPPTLDGSLPFASPPSSQSSSKIPKPRYYSRSFTHRIQPCDMDHFNAVKVLIRDTIMKFLDCSRPWKEQNKAAISALTSVVASGSPMFDQYEDSWPILYYCYHHFHHRRSQFKRADQTKRRSPRKCRARRAIGSEQPVLSETRTKKGKGRKENPRPGTSTSLEDEPLSIIQSEQSLPAASDQCGSNPVRPRSNFDEQDILDFLLSMNRALGYLLDRFISAGIESKAQLLVAAQWPRDERDIFFRTEVRLSPFQWKIVRDGLDKISL